MYYCIINTLVHVDLGVDEKVDKWVVYDSLMYGVWGHNTQGFWFLFFYNISLGTCKEAKNVKQGVMVYINPSFRV